MGWLSIVILEQNTYPSLMKEFYKHIIFIPSSNNISCLLKGIRIKITRTLLHTLLKLDKCENQVFCHMFHLIIEGYNPISSYPRIARKNFEHPIKLSANQLTLPCEFFTQHHCLYHSLKVRTSEGGYSSLSYYSQVFLSWAYVIFCNHCN